MLSCTNAGHHRNLFPLKSTDYSDLLATDIDAERFRGKGKRNVQQALSFDDAVCIELPRLFAGEELRIWGLFWWSCLILIFEISAVAALAKVFEDDKLVAKSIQIDAAVARIYTFALQVSCFVFDRFVDLQYGTG